MPAVRSRCCCGVAAGLLLAVAGGCGGGSRSVPVEGRVTFDGRPIEEGTILFRSPSGPVMPASGPIEDGRYTVLVTPGPKIVEVMAARTTGSPDPLMQVRPRQQYIPDRYNIRSTLTAEVKADGPNSFDFALTRP